MEKPWSWKPVKRPNVPTPPVEFKNWVRSPVDAFVLEKLLANGLKPSPEADRRTLIRRVSLDLTGLPPTSEEVTAFVDDPSLNAYEKLVDRLLASPRYGERWARHWLDVAHYADSHGQDQDRPRPNAWPYRDYVIRAFNADKPYARFVREQVAGDVLYPDDPDAIAATGFLAAGPWDESGVRDIREDSIDRQIARYLDRDDIVSSTLSAFAGMTVGCARCHDHKFDPISQDDYYALQATFAGIDKAERAYDADPAIAKKRAASSAALAKVRAMKGKADASLLTAERKAEITVFEREWQSAATRWIVPEPAAIHSKHGSTLKALPDQSVLATGARPERDTYTVILATDRVALTGLRLEVLDDESLPHRGPGRQDNGNLHLSEVRVTVQPKGKPGPSTPVKLKAAKADFDQAGWGISRAIDGDPTTAWGIYPEVGKPHRVTFEFDKAVGFDGGTVLTIELDQLHGGGHLIGRFRLALTTTAAFGESDRPLPADLAEIVATPAEKRTIAQNAELARWLMERNLEKELASLPPQAKVYCGTNRFAVDGSFRPTPTPRPVHLLKRGDIQKPGKLAVPGAVEALPIANARFKLADPNDEGQSRIALANWLTDPAQPLTWRVIANRVWHYHFGKGIVDTPNDFGKMGGPPSHPELLDWLAIEFRDGGGSFKKLHRLIVTSSTYRQTVKHDAAAAAKDSDNRLLWRMNRGRLDAESIRDAVLLVSGRLDGTQYGPPVKHFIMKPGVHVTPIADYDNFDVDSPDARRRSIYRYVFRTRPDPLLEALDCPDASQSAPARATSVGPTQALALWNNKFTLRHAEHLAALVQSRSRLREGERGGARGGAREAASGLDRVRDVCNRVLCRTPTEAELKSWTAFVEKHGLANLCRVLFNSTEFLFID